jgi:hypothetical protein
MADEGQRRMLSFDNDVRALIKEAVEAEREACAKLLDGTSNDEYVDAVLHAHADEIRARGQG